MSVNEFTKVQEITINDVNVRLINVNVMMQYMRHKCEECRYSFKVKNKHMGCLHPLVERILPEIEKDFEEMFDSRIIRVPADMHMNFDLDAVMRGDFRWPLKFYSNWIRKCEGYVQKG
jgi:hypothetical protein